jgi:hypothetical protein
MINFYNYNYVILLINLLILITFVTARSDLWAIQQRKCKNGEKEVSIVA